MGIKESDTESVNAVLDKKREDGLVPGENLDDAERELDLTVLDDTDVRGAFSRAKKCPASTKEQYINQMKVILEDDELAVGSRTLSCFVAHIPCCRREVLKKDSTNRRKRPLLCCQL